MRSGYWVYISGKGGGGFNASKPGEHALGGPAALQFAGETNSDITAGKFKPDAPAAQLYDLRADRSQTHNLVREHPQRAARMRARLAAIRAASSTRPE